MATRMVPSGFRRASSASTNRNPTSSSGRKGNSDPIKSRGSRGSTGRGHRRAYTSGPTTVPSR